MASDQELLEAWRTGQRQAGEALFERHADSVIRFFRNKVPDSAVKDLAQQTFMGCIQGRDRLRAGSSFRSYLFAIAHRQFCKYLRTKYRHGQEIDFEECSMHDLEPDPLAQLTEHREQRLLLRALRTIPVAHQVLLELRYWEEMKTREIAEIMDVQHATIRTRLRRAQALLKEAIERLAESARVLESTLDNLEAWVRRCRAHLVASEENGEPERIDS